MLKLATEPLKDKTKSPKENYPSHKVHKREKENKKLKQQRTAVETC